MLRAAVYARYSSDNQREESIDAQLRAIREYSDKNEINIVKIYIDEALTATTDNRPQFLQMISDSKHEIFDVVIVHKLDRFSRDRYDSAIYKRQLKLNNVRVISVLEQLDDSPESIILESVLEGMAEYYSRNLSREVKKGQFENAIQCKHTGGLPALGYDLNEDLTYRINESEAQIVHTIFKMYASGFSYKDIIDVLNNRGYRTKKGNYFGNNSLHDILRNEKYIGNYVFGKKNRQVKGRNLKKFKDEKEVTRIEGGVPQIIDIELWNKVQSTMDKNRHAPAANKAVEPYLLSGIIFCGKCGGAMVGNRKKSGSGNYHYSSYECSTRKRTRQCDMISVNKNKIEEIVINDLVNSILSKKNIKELAEKVHAYAKSQQKELEGDITLLDKEFKSVQKEIDNIINAIAAGMFHESMKEKMNMLEEKKSNIKSRIVEAELQMKINSPKLKDIVKFLEKDVDIKDKSPDEQKEIINRYIKKILVFEDFFDTTYIVDFNGAPERNRTPAKHALGGHCSILLSYRCIFSDKIDFIIKNAICQYIAEQLNIIAVINHNKIIKGP